MTEPSGGDPMKNDQAINLRVDEAMFRSIGHLAAEIDCTQAELIRTCVRLALPMIESHPYLIQLLPHQQKQASNTR
jgi:hypothetical protein